MTQVLAYGIPANGGVETRILDIHITEGIQANTRRLKEVLSSLLSEDGVTVTSFRKLEVLEHEI